MDTLWSEHIRWIIEHQVKPGERAIIKDFNRNQVEILDVFYMEHIKKYSKLIHLSKPFIISGIEHFEFEWETRMSLNEIILYLGESYFIQVNKNTIVRTVSLQGRKSDWSKIQIVGLNRFVNENQKWIAKEIILGEKYIDQIRNILDITDRIEFKNFNLNSPFDVLYINPLDIIYIDILQKNKVVYLKKPYAKNNKNYYIINWKTEYSASKILEHLVINNFCQVNRNQIVNLEFSVTRKFDKNQKEFNLCMIDGTMKAISIGKPYLKNLI